MCYPKHLAPEQNKTTKIHCVTVKIYSRQRNSHYICSNTSRITNEIPFELPEIIRLGVGIIKRVSQFTHLNFLTEKQ